MIDTTTRAAAANYGIEATGATITAVSVSTNTLIVDLATNAAVTIRSAYTAGSPSVGKSSAYTNIRDSAVIPNAASGNGVHRHWLPVIEEVIA